MRIVDRESFIAWTDGKLDINPGLGVENVHADFPEIEKMLADGKTIGMTEAGVLFTTIKYDPDKNMYVEKFYHGKGARRKRRQDTNSEARN